MSQLPIYVLRDLWVAIIRGHNTGFGRGSQGTCMLRIAKHLYFWGSLITPSENSVTRYAKHFHGNPQDPKFELRPIASLCEAFVFLG